MPTIKTLRCHTLFPDADYSELDAEYRVVKETGDHYRIHVPYYDGDKLYYTEATFTKKPDRKGLSYATWFTLAEITI